MRLLIAAVVGLGMVGCKTVKSPDLVKCTECKHLVERDDMQIVVAEATSSSFKDELFYCPIHVKKYDKTVTSDVTVIVDNRGNIMGYPVTEYFKKVPEHWEEVKEDGSPIK